MRRPFRFHPPRRHAAPPRTVRPPRVPHAPRAPRSPRATFNALRRRVAPLFIIRRRDNPGATIGLVALVVFVAFGIAYLAHDYRKPTVYTIDRNPTQTTPPVIATQPKPEDSELPSITYNPEFSDPLPPTPIRGEVSIPGPMTDDDSDSDTVIEPPDAKDPVGTAGRGKTTPATGNTYTLPPRASIVKPRKNTTPSALDREVWEKLNASSGAPLNIPGEAPERASLRALAERYAKIPAIKVVANPLAADFPGAVPDSAPRIYKNVQLPGNIHGWKSTGLYAPPGEVITVRVSASDAHRGLSVRIGCHTDDLFHPECVGWPRYPRIVSATGINKMTTEIASPFGGLIYIDGGGGGKSNAKFAVSISGAVEAPYFKLGETTAAEWARLRKAGAPWGELSCRTITLSVPSVVLRELEDPTKVMQVWERIIDAQDWLADYPKRVNNPERLVPDAKTSIGYMHSGYPVMCHANPSARHMVDYEYLTTNGDYGFFHEYGHNHQNDEWTFAGYGETTCNIFALYCMEVIAGRKRGEGGPNMDAHLEKKLADPKGANGSDDLLAIYVPVIRAFGWEPLKKTFGEYNKSKSQDFDLRQMRKRADSHSKGAARRREASIAAAGPSTDDLRKEAFVRIWSKHTKANLAPYFEKVGYPIGEATKRLLSKYKPWMPPGLEPEKKR